MKLPRIKFRKTLIGLAISALVYITGALCLVHMAEPTFEKPLTFSPEKMQESGLNFAQDYGYTPVKFSMRDNLNLAANQFGGQSNTTIILIHGILSSNFTFNTTAGLLSENTGARVIALDLRGHGQSDGAPGDIDYIDQYLDDIEDVVASIQDETPKESIILAGHSMGGGIIMRYVLEEDRRAVDGYLLFAPALGYNSPTAKNESSESDEQFAQIHLARIIGLSMLNNVFITRWHELPVMFFNLPEDTPLTRYSFRSLMSMSPDDPAKAFQAVSKPLLLIVGKGDQMFRVDQFEPLVKDNSDGKVLMIEDANHNSVHYHPEALEAISSWLNTTLRAHYAEE